REREVIELRFGLRDGQPRTLEEVARTYGITRERIRQIEARGLLKLRQPLRSQRLAEFAEAEQDEAAPERTVRGGRPALSVRGPACLLGRLGDGTVAGGGGKQLQGGKHVPGDQEPEI